MKHALFRQTTRFRGRWNEGIPVREGLVECDWPPAAFVAVSGAEALVVMGSKGGGARDVGC